LTHRLSPGPYSDDRDAFAVVSVVSDDSGMGMEVPESFTLSFAVAGFGFCTRVISGPTND